MKVRVASAGTGKTTSLVKRYLELTEVGMPLRRVAGVTFTRAAAAELRQRVAAGLREVIEEGSYLGGLHLPGRAGLEPYREAVKELGGTVITTIHGFMRAALRLNAPLLSLDPNFAMLAEWEAAALFEEELASLRLLAADPSHPLHPALVIAGEDAAPVALALFRQRSLAEELAFSDDPLSSALAQLYQEAYERLVRRLGGRALGPGEVERAALRLLGSPTARQRLASRFPLVLVDEYQDVNPLQGSFFERLADLGVRLEVVGDPKQSIYGFRSADVGVFRRALDRAERTGELLEPLRESRRHSQALVGFLNRLTTRLAADGLGFEPREAPAVTSAGPQAEVAGSVRVLVVEGEAALSELRAFEADALALALQRQHLEQGVEYDAMAVVARTNRLLEVVERALQAHGIPSLMLRGSGMFERVEIRDVRHALQVGVRASGPSLAKFLRSPFAALSLGDLAAVVRAREPLSELARRRPDVAQTIQELQRVTRLGPLDAVKAATRDPLVSGRRYVDMLDDAARANVDAMLFDLSTQAPPDLELLLGRLDQLASRSETAPVPESGSGVKLSTVHGAKGLEYPVVAIFDAGARERYRPHAVLVDAVTGEVALRAAGNDTAAQERRRERERQESYRLLYVAASRARDTLVISGSVSRHRPQGWLEALLDMGFEGGALPGVSVERLAWRPVASVAAGRPTPRAGLEPSDWVERSFEHDRHGPLSSPSRLVALMKEGVAREAVAERSDPERGAAKPGATGASAQTAAAPTAAALLADEPLAWSESLAAGDDQQLAGVGDDGAVGETPVAAGTGGDELPGRGRVLGTLVHFAIGHDWTTEDHERLASLRTQEVMFPYSREQQDSILAEVRELLGNYQAMVGRDLPTLQQRLEDRAELPLAYPGGATVWEGVVDRLYRTADGWVVDDYKTDWVVQPERYYLQLGLYLHAVALALGVRPRGRLVYLRSRTVVEPPDAALTEALERSGIVTAEL